MARVLACQLELPGARGLGDIGGSDTQIQVKETYERIFEAGDTVFEEGTAGAAVFVIQSGEVELSRLGASGRKAVARLGAGEFFGEMSVIVGERRNARAVAVVPTRLIQLDAATFEAMCVERPEVAIRVIRLLTARLTDSERRLSKLGIDDLLRPMVRVLVESAVQTEGALRIRTTLRQLSHDTGLTMLEAHRALHQLFDSKALRLVDNELVTPGLDSLTSCLESAA